MRRIVCMIFICLGSLVAAAAKDVALVSNKDNGIQAVTTPELVKICKGQTSRWPDGKPVTFVMLDPGSAEMKVVVQKLYESTPDQVKSVILAANHDRTNHPAVVIVTSDEALVQKVAGTPGAVGVVDVYAITSSVNVIKVSGKLPLEPGYLLHGN
ncbi:MAG TPA: substrate-binding domain-containing protein [Terriglobales bacterium]|nr:substrate-binding domain-containing protein [Terriglobales bacterium]